MIPRIGLMFGMVCSAILALCATSASATSVADLVRIKGQERNVLTGMGIVVGLNGTGDSSKASFLTARPYAKLLENMQNPVGSLEELVKADAYAIVMLTMEVPATGVREGDRLDVSVATMYNAKSLRGGLLVVAPMYLPLPLETRGGALAQVNGPIVIDGENQRTGVVRGGGQMLRDVRTNPVTPSGSMTLVLKDHYAGYPNAAMIAAAINDEFAVEGYTDVAVVEEAKAVRVLLPEADRREPANFIATLMRIPVDPSLIQNEARIVINERHGIIVVTGDVVIGPVAITHRGLSITSISPPPVPTREEPVMETRRWAGMDTTDRRGRSSTRLVDLLAAFDQLSVPVKDQIAVIYELQKTGSLHAEIVNK